MSNSGAAANCSQSDLEAMKQEILREMRLEINKMKQEIIEGKLDSKGFRYHLGLLAFGFSDT